MKERLLKTVQVLTIGSDPALETEFTDAAKGLKGYVAVATAARDLARGADVALDRVPDVVLLPIDRDAQELRTFSQRLHSGGHFPLLLGACSREDVAGHGQLLLGALRADVKDFLRRPLSSVELQEVFDRHFRRDAANSRRSGRLIAFVSNKGGIGKSTLAVSLAVALARKSKDRVLLVDASLQLGVCASSLDLDAQTTLADAARERDRLDETLLRELSVPHASGLRLLASPRDAVEAAQIDERAIGRVLSVARREFDYVVIDTFPLIDAVAVAILDLSDRVYVVTGSSVPHVIGAERLLSVFDRMAVPRGRQRVILNQTHPRFAGQLTPSEVAQRLGRDIDHVFPFDKRVLVALNTGEPYAGSANPFLGFGKALKALVNDVERTLPVTSAAQRAEVNG